MNKPTLACLLGAGLGLAAPRATQAQAKPTPDRVYTYVEQMPQLPGGGGQAAIAAAISKNFRAPTEALRSRMQGRVYLRFTVASTGRAEEVQVVQGLTPAIDAAAIEAVKRLPAFEPGKQNGRAVPVSLTIPLVFRDGVPSTAAATPPPEGFAMNEEATSPAADSLSKVYTYVEQMPQLLGGGGQAAIVAAVQRNVVLPADAVEGRVFAKFIVGPRGSVYQPEIVKGLSTSIDAAVLAAIRKLPRFEAGKQNGRAVAVSFTVPVLVYLPNHVFEVREVQSRAHFAPPAGLYDYLRRNLKVPAVVATEKLHGTVGVDVVVQADGRLAQPTLTSHLCSSCDDEVLRLVRAMPVWQPARARTGEAVAVRQHLDIPLPLPDASTPYVRPERPATYAQQPPTLLDGTPLSELAPVLAQGIRYPALVQREKISGQVQVEFVVDATGVVREPRVTQSVCTSCDQAVLDALQALSPLVPARQDSQAVPFQTSLSVPFNKDVK